MNDKDGPCRVVALPEAMDTNRRYFEAYCPICTTHEGLFEIEDSRVHAIKNDHNAMHWTTPLPGFNSCSGGKSA